MSLAAQQYRDDRIGIVAVCFRRQQEMGNIGPQVNPDDAALIAASLGLHFLNVLLMTRAKSEAAEMAKRSARELAAWMAPTGKEPLAAEARLRSCRAPLLIA